MRIIYAGKEPYRKGKNITVTRKQQTTTNKMLTLKLITEEKERVVEGLRKKHFNNAEEAIGSVLAGDKRPWTRQRLRQRKNS